MKILDVEIKETQTPEGTMFSFSFLGMNFGKLMPKDCTQKGKFQEHVSLFAKQRIQKKIIEELYKNSKKEGKYFVTDYAGFKKAFEKYKDKAIGSVFCGSVYRKDGPISFWTDNDLALKLKREAI
jgi:hypothetical protein